MSWNTNNFSPGDIKFTRINATADGDNTVVAAVTGKKIRVIAYTFTLNAAGVIAFKSGAGTTLASFKFVDGGGASYVGSVMAPAFETAAGEAFVVNCAAGVDTLGHLTYVEAT